MGKTFGARAALSVLLCAGFLTGCGTGVDADHNLVYVDKNGKVTTIEVEALDRDYYGEEALTEFVDSAVDAYNAKRGEDAVTVESLSVEDGTAKLKLRYDTTDDYTAFRGVEFYQGTVVSALAAGYDFEGVTFAAVSGGEVTGSVARSEVAAAGDSKVVILKADSDTDVKVPGRITYISCENVTVTAKDTVAICEGTAADAENVSGESDTEATGTMVIEGGIVFDTGAADTESGAESDGDFAADEDSDTALVNEESGYTYIIYR